MNKSPKILAFTALTGAAYATATVALAPISFGVLQFRLSEALCIIPFFVPQTVWGLYIGCLIANLVTGNVIDIIFGSLATLLAGLVTGFFGKRGCSLKCKVLACLSPVVFNGLIIGAIITSAYNGISVFEHPEIFAINAAEIALCEAAVMFVLGLPLINYLPRNRFFSSYIDELKSASGR